MVSHLDSLWNRGTRELGNGLFNQVLAQNCLKIMISHFILYNKTFQCNCLTKCEKQLLAEVHAALLPFDKHSDSVYPFLDIWILTNFDQFCANQAKCNKEVKFKQHAPAVNANSDPDSTIKSHETHKNIVRKRCRTCQQTIRKLTLKWW